MKTLADTFRGSSLESIDFNSIIVNRGFGERDFMDSIVEIPLLKRYILPQNLQQATPAHLAKMKDKSPENMQSIKRVNCPTCQKIVEWKEENTFRPFCSKKCQLIDFGDWANERHAIPVENGPEDFKVDELETNFREEDL